MSETVKQRRDSLLAWYDAEGRSLPWRIRPEGRAAGQVADPYAVWLSEIMLQQTTVPHATPYWLKFLRLWPRVEDLAAAEREQVMKEWAGLGYYARARNLHACAKVVAHELGGVFPQEEKALRALPGVGEYTAAAIRAAAFDLPASVVDGNVERVITRLFRVQTPLPKSKTEIKARAAEIASPDRPGDYAQAIMDLGATVCLPKGPLCERCPWAGGCDGRAEGDALRYPLKLKKKPKPVRHGVAFRVEREGELWLRRRPDQGLLGGMMETPGTPWREEGWEASEALDHAPFAEGWRPAGEVRHVFTHFELRLQVWRAGPPAGWVPAEGEWALPEEAGLPSVFLKASKV